jgi:hypothetical protein
MTSIGEWYEPMRVHALARIDTVSYIVKVHMFQALLGGPSFGRIVLQHVLFNQAYNDTHTITYGVSTWI